MGQLVSAFADCDLSGAVLHVVAGSEDLYSAADGWKDFGSIVGDLSADDYNKVTVDGVTYLCGAENATAVSADDALVSAEILADVTFDGRVLPVTAIGQHAFSDCTGLTEVTIGASVTSMAPYAFTGCDALVTVNTYAVEPPVCTGDVDGIIVSAFEGCDLASATLNVLGGVKDSYTVADVWKDFGTILGESAIDSVAVSAETAVMGVYNTAGVRVADTTAGLAPGIYLVRRGSAVIKISVR